MPPARDKTPSDQQLAGDQPTAPQWQEVTEWARTQTATSALFLIPSKLDFTAAAQRRSWTGWKEGAASMWEPGLYADWRARMDAVTALHSSDAMLSYACSQHIDYIVSDKRPGRALPGATHQPAFENRWFAVIPVSDCARHSRRG